MVESSKLYDIVASSAWSEEVISAFSKRASLLKTRQQTQKLAKEQAERDAQKHGLSAESYWEQLVDSEAAAFKYYQLYFPEYPELLQRALAARIAQVIEKTRTGDELTESELKLVSNAKAKAMKKEQSTWNIEAELREQAELALAAKKEGEQLQ